jgi:predicted RND superfamily exporter protein
VWGWAVQCRCLLLFFICFVSFDPFLHIIVATGFVVILCFFVMLLLGVEFDLY